MPKEFFRSKPCQRKRYASRGVRRKFEQIQWFVLSYKMYEHCQETVLLKKRNYK